LFDLGDGVAVLDLDGDERLGVTGEWEHPRFWDAVERVARAARGHGIHWAILPPSPAAARRCVDLGCRMLSLGLDTWAVTKGLRAFQADYAEYFAEARQR
jgi:2-keto-3-deoxy-L-rhamnonate aldolase RhmA